MRQHIYTTFTSNNRASFHLWWKENLVKHHQVSKYYETDCRSKWPFLRTSVTYFFISNLVAQVPDLNLAENLSNLHRNCEVLNKQSTFCIFYLSQNNGLEKFMFPNVKKVVKFQNGKNKFNTVIQYNTINTRNLCLSYKFIVSWEEIFRLSVKKLYVTYKQAWFLFKTF